MGHLATMWATDAATRFVLSSYYSLQENCSSNSDLGGIIEILGATAIKKDAMIDKLQVSNPYLIIAAHHFCLSN
jgi:hypothetical protein